jgi:hypothetical protein
VNGLKEDIRYTVQSQVLEDVDRAVLLAKIQQRIVDRGKTKWQNQTRMAKTGGPYQKPDSKVIPSTTNLW